MLKVSGNSPVLNALLQAASAQSPWLSVEADSLKIDWNLAASYRSQIAGLAPWPETLVHECQNLLPQIELSEFAIVTHEHSRRRLDDTNQPKSNRAGIISPIPLNFLQTLNNFAEVAVQLEIIVQQNLRKKSIHHHIRAQLEGFLNYFHNCQMLTRIDRLSSKVEYSYSLKNRLSMRTGDVFPFVTGSLSNSYWSSKPQHIRLELCRLGRRFVRAQTDFCQQLEEWAKFGVPTNQNILNIPSFGNTIRQLADLQKRMACLLNPAVAQGIKKRGFVNSTLNIAVLPDDFSAEKAELADAKDKNLRCQFNIGRLSLYTAMDLLAEMPNIFERLRQVIGPLENSELLDEVHSAAYNAGLALRHFRVELPFDLQTHHLACHEIDAAMEWIIAESLLLNLLSSGCLSVYACQLNQGSFGLCLSPWLTASRMSKKWIGALPLTYLAGNSFSEEQDSEIEEAVSDQEKDKSMSGQIIWDLFMSHSV